MVRPQRLKDWQENVGWEARGAMLGNPPLDGALEVNLVFVRSDRRKCDLDNLSKAVLDAMENIVYLNDQQIVSLRLRKYHHKEHPHVYITVREIEDE